VKHLSIPLCAYVAVPVSTVVSSSDKHVKSLILLLELNIIHVSMPFSWNYIPVLFIIYKCWCQLRTLNVQRNFCWHIQWQTPHQVLIVQFSCYVWNVNYIVDHHPSFTFPTSWNGRLLQLNNFVALNFFEHRAPCAKSDWGDC
jgi:hypothetical protein